MRATLRTVLWQMPLILVMAVANPLFSAMGSTELFRIGLRAFYLESLVFGACMGAMLSCVLLCCSRTPRSALSSDKVMALFGNVAPHHRPHAVHGDAPRAPVHATGRRRWATCSARAPRRAPAEEPREGCSLSCAATCA